MISKEDRLRKRLLWVKHYAKVLRKLRDSYLEGGVQQIDALREFDREWLQIEDCQAWVSAIDSDFEDFIITILKADFAESGFTLMQLRIAPTKHVSWLETGLAAINEMLAHGVEAREWQGVILGNLGTVYRQLNRYIDAIKCYQTSGNIARETGNHRDEALSILRKGNIFSLMGDQERAVESYEIALKIFRKIDDRFNVGLTHMNLGNAYRLSDQFNLSREFTDKALAVFREVGSKVDEGHVLLSAGMTTFHGFQEYTLTIEYCHQALEIAQQFNDRETEAEAYNYLSLAFYGLGKVEKAIEFGESAVTSFSEIDSTRLPAIKRNLAKWKGETPPEVQNKDGNNTANRLVYLAALYHRLNNDEEALTKLNEAILSDPSSELAYCNRAGLFASREQYDDALADLSKAFDLNPEYPWFYTTRGRVYFKMKEYEKALSDITYSIKLKSDDTGPYLLRGQVYFEIGKFSEALANFDRVIELDPKHADGYYNRGLIYHEKLKNHKKAVENYSKAVELDANFNTYNNRGNLLTEIGQYAAALEDYDHAMKIDPTNYRAYFGKGVVYGELKQYKEALLNYDQAIKLAPDNVKVFYNRGLVHNELKNYDQALEDLNHYIRLDPTFNEAYKSRGAIYALNGNHQKAVVDFSKAIDSNPNDPDAYFNRGQSYNQLQKYNEALRDYRKAIKLNPQDAQAHYRAGAILMKMGRLQQATNSFLQAGELGVTKGFEAAALYGGLANLLADDEIQIDDRYYESELEQIKSCNSLAQVKQLAGEIPFILESDFIHFLEQQVSHESLPSHKKLLKQRLKWLGRLTRRVM